MMTDRFLTTRLQGFGTTIFSEMSALAVAHDAVNLGQGFPDFEPDPRLVRAAQTAMAEGHNQYAPGVGIQSLRAAIARHDHDYYAIAYDETSEITVTTGATEAMFATLQALVDAGDEVVVFEPVYDVYPAAVAMAGGVTRAVAMRPGADGTWRFEPDHLRAAITARTKAILVNTPHNPTGTVFEDEQLAVIADVAIDRDLVVVTDEVYEHLVYDGRAHRPIATLPGMRDRTVRISSAGKTFSVTGWKVGWACASPALTDAIRAAKQWVTFTSGTPFQHAIAEGLSWGPGYTDRLAEEYTARRDHLVDGLAALGLGMTRTNSTYFVVVDITPLGFTDDADFCRRLPVEVGVAAIPLRGFAAARTTETTTHVRFAFCKSTALLDEGLERLREGLPGMAR